MLERFIEECDNGFQLLLQENCKLRLVACPSNPAALCLSWDCSNFADNLIIFLPKPYDKTLGTFSLNSVSRRVLVEQLINVLQVSYPVCQININIERNKNWKEIKLSLIVNDMI